MQFQVFVGEVLQLNLEQAARAVYVYIAIIRERVNPWSYYNIYIAQLYTGRSVEREIIIHEHCRRDTILFNVEHTQAFVIEKQELGDIAGTLSHDYL